jgi:hypothetical protein
MAEIFLNHCEQLKINISAEVETKFDLFINAWEWLQFFIQAVL